MLAFARGELAAFGDLPVVLAGFSFGSYVQTRVAHTMTPERMVLIGPAVKRFPVEQVPPDTIVIHGEEDDVVALTDVLAWARPQRCGRGFECEGAAAAACQGNGGAGT